MKKVLIDVSANHRYPIYIGKHLYPHIKKYIKKEYSRVLIITDSNVAKLYLNDMKTIIDSKYLYTFTIPSGEHSKNIETFYAIHSKLIHCGFDRNSLIIALGGGMVGDVAGFAAATFMRGIDFIQIPTTILAHDSSIGGKVAINHELGKNMIGQFYHPQVVLYDTNTFKSLPQMQIRSGYAELIKEALIADNDFLEELLTRRLNSIEESVEQDIFRGIQIKKSIVEEDEKEHGIRKYLNLGHTLAHALEAYTSYEKFTHGEAVAVGLLFVLYISNKEFDISLPYEKIKEWMEINDYPLKIEPINFQEIINLMKADKKNENQVIQMILLKNIGEPYIQPLDDFKTYNYLRYFFEELGRE